MSGSPIDTIATVIDKSLVVARRSWPAGRARPGARREGRTRLGDGFATVDDGLNYRFGNSDELISKRGPRNFSLALVARGN